MTFYYAKNESGQCLDRNTLWGKLHAEKTFFSPTREGLLVFGKKEIVGQYEICSISSAEVAKLAEGVEIKPQGHLDMENVVVGGLTGIDPKRYRDFAEAYKKLTAEFAMPFQPNAAYSPAGDTLVVKLTEDSTWSEMVAPGLAVERGVHTKFVEGIRITGLLENLLGPGDPDNKAMIVPFEIACCIMVHVQSIMYDDKEYKISPTLTSFILACVRHWPTLKSYTWVEKLSTGEVAR